MTARSLVALIASCFFLTLSAAQEKAIQLQFVTFPKITNAEPVELLTDDGEAIQVELPTNRLSQVYKVMALQEWILGKSSTDEEGDFTFDAYGKAPAIASDKQLILVIRKGDRMSEGLTLIPMSMRQEGFGGGKYLLINAAKVDIGVAMGDLKFVLRPQNRRLVEPTPSEVKNDREYLYVYTHFRKGDEAVPFYSGTWRFSEKARVMVFYYHHPHTDQLRTHSIRDYLR